jgi:hypothetical protein
MAEIHGYVLKWVRGGAQVLVLDVPWYFFCTRKGSGRSQKNIYSNTWQVTILQTDPFKTLALKNQKFEDKICHITKNTLKLRKGTQLGPWVPPPPNAGVLNALPPRNRAQSLEHSFPA